MPTPEELEAAKKAQEEDSIKPPMSEEDIGRMVNAAVSSHIKRVDVAKAVEEQFAKLDLDKVIAAQMAKALPKASPKPPPHEAPPGEMSPEVKRTLEDLNARLEASETARKEEARMRAETERARSFDTAKSDFRALVAPSLRPELVDVFIRDQESLGKLKVKDDGSTTLTVRRAPFKGAPEQDEDLPLKEAIPILLTQREVSPFLPAPGGPPAEAGTRRAGMIPARPSIPSSAGASDGDKAQQVLDQLRALGIDPGSL